MFERRSEAEEAALLDKAKGAVKHLLVGASMAGAAGATVGAVLAALRNESMRFYAASMGSNFFLLSSTYIALEEVIADKRDDKKDWITGATAGLVTGGFYAGVVGGRVRGVQGAAAGAAVGVAVVFGREKFHEWRLSKGVQRYEAKYGEAPAVYHPTTAVLVESQGPPRELAFPSLLPQSIKIADEEIERRIVARMEELQREARAGNEQDDDTRAADVKETEQNEDVQDSSRLQQS